MGKNLGDHSSKYAVIARFTEDLWFKTEHAYGRNDISEVELTIQRGQEEVTLR